MKIKDKAGGPAFPVHPETIASLGVAKSDSHAGMTLMDYFAAEAMKAHIAENYRQGSVDTFGILPFSDEQIAEFAYESAAAMIEMRG